MGHLNYDTLKRMAKGKAVIGLPDNPILDQDSFCEDCTANKLTQQPFSDRKDRATSILDLIHSDICGPFRKTTQSGKRYLLTFIDDHSRKAYVYFLAAKNEALDKFKEFKASVKNETG